MIACSLICMLGFTQASLREQEKRHEWQTSVINDSHLPSLAPEHSRLPVAYLAGSLVLIFGGRISYAIAMKRLVAELRSKITAVA